MLPVLRLSAVESEIMAGDLLLWLPTSLLGRAIATLSRGPFSHAALADWGEVGALVMLDQVFLGGRRVELADQVRRYPGRIVWFRANPGRRFSWNRWATVLRMRRYVDIPYGFGNLWKNALSYSVLTRWIVRPSEDDGQNGTPPICSQAVSAAYRAGGIDPVLGVGDCWTTPNQLANSLFFQQQGVLVP